MKASSFAPKCIVRPARREESGEESVGADFSGSPAFLGCPQGGGRAPPFSACAFAAGVQGEPAERAHSRQLVFLWHQRKEMVLCKHFVILQSFMVLRPNFSFYLVATLSLQSTPPHDLKKQTNIIFNNTSRARPCVQVLVYFKPHLITLTLCRGCCPYHVSYPEA